MGDRFTSGCGDGLISVGFCSFSCDGTAGRKQQDQGCPENFESRAVPVSSIGGICQNAITPASRWHEQIGDATLADGILDRLVYNAHRIEMRGDSMRKNRGKPNG